MYEVTTDGQSQPQIEALTDSGLRTIVFGPAAQGMITFMILEGQRRVDILDVLWIG